MENPMPDKSVDHHATEAAGVLHPIIILIDFSKNKKFLFSVFFIL
jgi:hypothetical protein